MRFASFHHYLVVVLVLPVGALSINDALMDQIVTTIMVDHGLSVQITASLYKLKVRMTIILVTLSVHVYPWLDFLRRCNYRYTNQTIKLKDTW